MLVQSRVHEIRATISTSTHATKTVRFGHGLQFMSSLEIIWEAKQDTKFQVEFRLWLIN